MQNERMSPERGIMLQGFSGGNLILRMVDIESDLKETFSTLPLPSS